MPAQQNDFLDMYRAGLAEMLAMTRSTLDEFEQLRSRQLEAIREALTENAALTGEIAGAQDMERLLAIQARFANHQMEVALGYWGRLCEAASHTQLDAMRRLEAQATKFNQRATAMLDSAPAGTEPLAAAMRAFLEAAQTPGGRGAPAPAPAARAPRAQVVTATAGI
ncbi:MAG: phasin family protein, partial [Burkholderiales bacterium]|nr:phasin family protein [Burkholderiales bacterium]